MKNQEELEAWQKKRLRYKSQLFDNGLAKAAIERYRPKRVIDMGCGLGWYLETAKSLGVNDILGIDFVEGLENIVSVPFLRRDLKKPFDNIDKADMAYCLEVFEHIPEEFAHQAVKNLTQLSDIIVFSAAPPGQGGIDHVNERDKEYWRGLFAAHSFFENKEETKLLLQHSRIPWIVKNLMVLQRRGLEKKSKNSSIKYSVLMPYFDRGKHFENTLKSFQFHYSDRDDWEIVVVEDPKNVIDSEKHDHLINTIGRFANIQITLVGYHRQDNYNPCEMFNIAASHSRGTYLVLSNPEIIHESNVFRGFDFYMDAFERQYLICSCKNAVSVDLEDPANMKCELDTRLPWLVHSRYRSVYLHFCSVISKRLYNAIGGFDQAYLNGIAYDDDDFYLNILNHRIPAFIKDDLVVIHQTHDRNYGMTREEYLALTQVNFKYCKKKWYGKWYDVRLPLGDWIKHHTIGCEKVVEFGSMFFDKLSYVAPSVKKKIGIEIHQPYIDKAKYHDCEKIQGNFCLFENLINEDDMDCAMFVDTLEHIDRESALELMAKVKEKFNKVILMMPEGDRPQDKDVYNMGADEYQTHRSVWTRQDIAELGFQDVVVDSYLYGGPTIFAVWQKLKGSKL